ncbi:TrlF family AAA-like ATPase [Romboutsia lituseburensis]|uniref:TrlF family AAA-like ATPase n=1 Tax=Romboutsia lituseburensis TaxID=1537 RepID=UPI0022EAB329|nr:hypothetical protein [Romboutsia lituseburensis]
MKYKRGSEWRQWDLHLHTPSSYDYKSKSITNKMIIDELINNNISAVAITDHNVIDIDRIKELKELAGDRITIFPGIELRSELGGSEPVHYICIFPENIELDLLYNKFITKLNITEFDIKEFGKQMLRYKENPTDEECIKKGHESIYVRIESAADIVRSLGGISTIHAGAKHGTVEGLSNRLPERIAKKLEIVNNIDIYEVGKLKDINEYQEKVFPSIGKNIPTIICSDNHDIRLYERKEKLWIKADTTMEGLKQSIKEPKLRFYIGDLPNKSEIVRDNGNKFINNIKVMSNNNQENSWFNNEIDLNSDLVTIIGNKGNGKSALADIIGHAGNTRNSEYFSFLSKERFNRKPDNLGKNYKVEITWSNGLEEEKNLYPDFNKNLVERVKYLPQRYIEEICNDLRNGFNDEIERLIYDYLPENEKLDYDNLNDLIKFLIKDIQEDINLKDNKLRDINRTIILKEDESNSEKEEKLRRLYEDKSKEFAIEKNNKPDVVEKPQMDTETESRLKKLNERLENKIREKELKSEELSKLTKKEYILEDAKSNVNKKILEIGNWKIELNKSLDELDISIDVKLDINSIQIDNKLLELKETIRDIKAEIGNGFEVQGNINIEIEDIRKNIKEISKNLNESQIAYQNYINNLGKWEEKINILSKEIVSIDDKIKYIKEKVPKQLDDLRKERKAILKDIYVCKNKIIEKYLEKYHYVQQIINNSNQDEKLSLEIKLFSEKDNYTSKILEDINQSVKSILRGREEGRENLNKLLEEYNVDDFESIYSCLTNIESELKKTSNNNEKVYKDKESFYNKLYDLSNLQVDYELMLGNKDLSKLSPGEKGLVLLIFYLLLDKDDIPLIIDQPEDNLDNQSVYNRLVPYIIKAKERRQIIIVTHNPNIAIACDSEQIIYSEMNKENLEITYKSGSIESVDINKYIVNVLEGTMPAFDKRKSRYIL